MIETVFNANEQPVMIWSPTYERLQVSLKAGRNILRFSIDPLLLHGGTYRWCLQGIKKNSIGILIWLMRAGHFTVVAHDMTFGDTPYVPLASDFQLDQVVDR